MTKRLKWFAVGQRVRIFHSFEKARIFASGYIVDKNGIDILEAFWWLRLPNWVYAPRFSEHTYAMAQKILVHTRQRGFFIELDFEVNR